MIQKIGLFIIGFGFIFLTFGTIALFRYKKFYSRILTSCIVDITGFSTIILGLALYKGKEIGVLKLLFFLIIYIILNSISSHVLARGAYLSGVYVKEVK